MRIRGRALSALVAAAVAACAGDPRPTATQAGETVSGTVTVSAAASLTDAFREIGRRFEAAHPGARVRFNFGASSTLVEQIKQGAPADVVASADDSTMDKATDAGVTAGVPQTFVKNRLEIVVPADNPAGVAGIRDLGRPGVKVVLCADAVPCGRYAAEALQKAAVVVTPSSKEDNVKAVMSKVSLGEADAGVVYVTDVKAGGAKVKGVEIPSDLNVVATYRVASLRAARNPVGARAFVDHLLSPDAQSILNRHGFSSPRS